MNYNLKIKGKKVVIITLKNNCSIKFVDLAEGENIVAEATEAPKRFFNEKDNGEIENIIFLISETKLYIPKCIEISINEVL